MSSHMRKKKQQYPTEQRLEGHPLLPLPRELSQERQPQLGRERLGLFSSFTTLEFSSSSLLKEYDTTVCIRLGTRVLSVSACCGSGRSTTIGNSGLHQKNDRNCQRLAEPGANRIGTREKDTLGVW